MSKAGRQERHVVRQPSWQWESSHGWSSLAANIQQSQARWGGIPSACWAFMAVQRAALLPHQPVLIIADGLKSQELLQQDAETWLQWAGTRDEKPQPPGALCFIRHGSTCPMKTNCLTPISSPNDSIPCANCFRGEIPSLNPHRSPPSW